MPSRLKVAAWPFVTAWKTASKVSASDFMGAMVKPP